MQIKLNKREQLTIWEVFLETKYHYNLDVTCRISLGYQPEHFSVWTNFFVGNRPFCGKLMSTLSIHTEVGLGLNKRIFLAEVCIQHALRMFIELSTVSTKGYIVFLLCIIWANKMTSNRWNIHIKITRSAHELKHTSKITSRKILIL